MAKRIAVVFLATDSIGGTGRTVLYGATAQGKAVPLFDPSADLTVGAADYAFLPSAYAIGPDGLWFAATRGVPGSGNARDTDIFRLDPDGRIARIATAEGSALNNSAQEVEGTQFAGIVWNGAYHVVGSYPGSAGGEVIRVAPDGTVAAATDFDRTGATPFGSFVASGGALYFIGDQRSPLGRPDLWRIAADGSTEVVHATFRDGVVDLAATDGRVWFIAEDGNGRRQLFRLDDAGRPEPVPIGGRGEAIGMIHREGDQVVAALIDRAGGTRLVGLGDDGTVTDLSETLGGGFSEVEWFDGAWHAVGFRDGLLRIEADGRFVPVGDLPPPGRFPHGIGELTAIGDRLWFTATGRIDDGFGGFARRTMLWSMDEDGVVTQVAGLPYGARGFDLTGFLLAADLPVPIRHLFGTDGADRLEGSRRADRIVGAAGDDTLRGDRGHDRLEGGSGDDVLQGGAGRDRFVFAAGSGNDTVLDFRARDRIDLVALDLAFDDLQIGPGARPADSLIRFGEDSILLRGFAAADLTEGHFLF